MALFMNKQNERSELQERLAAEIQAKAKKRAQDEAAERPDGVTDSNYMKGTTQTGKYAWVWVVLGVILVVGAIYAVVYTS